MEVDKNTYVKEKEEDKIMRWFKPDFVALKKLKQIRGNIK